MPELPEVQTVCTAMDRVLTGRTITHVALHRDGVRTPFPAGLGQHLTKRVVSSVTRRAKYIVVNLNDGQVLLIHLGMSGRININFPADDYIPAKHDHMVITFDDGKHMVFNDARRFGMVYLLPTPDLDALPSLAALGPEPLDKAFTGKVLEAALAGKNTDIKAALMDQRVVAGLGNIYVCEALFYAGINPKRKASTIKGDEAKRLRDEIQRVLKAAIKAGGSTLRDYRQASGELGYFQHNFGVYDRVGKACPGCTCDIKKTGGIDRIVQAGRSTFFCARKQG